MAKNLGSIASAYSQKLNFMIFPLLEKSKKPATKNGLLDASLDQEIINKWWSHNPQYNIALRCGRQSNIWVLDVDGEMGLSDLEELESKYGSLPKTPCQKTTNGRHYLFRYPEDLEIRNATKIFKHDTNQGLDVRGEGGYIVLPPSIHPDSGIAYQWEVKPSECPFAYAPDWLIELVRKDDPFSSSHKSAHHILPIASSIRRDTSPDAILDDQIRLTMSAGEGSRNDTLNRAAFKAGKVVGGVDSISYDDAEKALVSAALTVGLDINEATRTVRSGLNAGLKDPYKYGQSSGGSFESSYDPQTGEIYEPKFSIEPLKIKGLIGDTVRWICSSAIMEQPELALFNVLAFAGAVFGRRYASPMDTRTNVYFIGIADTGDGKDHSRKMINKLAQESGLSVYVGANSIRSGAGLAQSMKYQASQLLMVDEFGLFLQALSDPKAASYHREISKMLMTLYSDSSGVYHHGILADSKADPIVLVQPCLSLYGTTTLGSYTPSLKSSAIESGNLNRFIVLPSKQNVSIKRSPDRGLPPDLIEDWSRFVDANIGIKNPCTDKPSYITEVKYAENIAVSDAIFELQCEGLEKRRTTKNGQLWGRYAENILKISMIMAIARNAYAPAINLDDLEFGKSIVTESIMYMSNLANEHMAQNEHEADKLAVLRFIKTGIQTKSAIIRNFRRLEARNLDSILLSLLEEGVITNSKRNTGGRPVDIFE